MKLSNLLDGPEYRVRWVTGPNKGKIVNESYYNIENFDHWLKSITVMKDEMTQAWDQIEQVAKEIL